MNGTPFLLVGIGTGEEKCKTIAEYYRQRDRRRTQRIFIIYNIPIIKAAGGRALSIQLYNESLSIINDKEFRVY